MIPPPRRFEAIYWRPGLRFGTISPQQRRCGGCRSVSNTVRVFSLLSLLQHCVCVNRATGVHTRLCMYELICGNGGYTSTGVREVRYPYEGDLHITPPFIEVSCLLGKRPSKG